MSRTLDHLSQLVAFDTVSANSNLDLMAYVTTVLSALDARLVRIPSPCGQKTGLYAELGRPGPGVLLSAHSDVVPVAGQDWSSDPFILRQDGGRVYGRGATDMKGFLASMLATAEDTAARTPNAPLRLVISYDEEVGCVGIQDMRARLAPLVDETLLCIVGEPTEMAVAVGHKGKAAFDVQFCGQAGHSALAPRFVNAIHAASAFVGHVQDRQAQLAADPGASGGYRIPYATLHVGRIHGGTALNVVPNQASVTFELRYLPGQDPNTLLAPLLARLPADATLTPLAAYPGFVANSNDGPIRRSLAWTDHGQPTLVEFGTEAGVFAELGVPTIVCGPGSMEGQGHKADEYITLDQLAACDAFLRRAVDSVA